MWQARRRDERHGTTEGKDTPHLSWADRARTLDLEPCRRTSSGPADILSAPKGRTYDRSCQVALTKIACQQGPSTYDRINGPEQEQPLRSMPSRDQVDASLFFVVCGPGRFTPRNDDSDSARNHHPLAAKLRDKPAALRYWRECASVHRWPGRGRRPGP